MIPDKLVKMADEKTNKAAIKEGGKKGEAHLPECKPQIPRNWMIKTDGVLLQEWT